MDPQLCNRLRLSIFGPSPNGISVLGSSHLSVSVCNLYFLDVKHIRGKSFSLRYRCNNREKGFRVYIKKDKHLQRQLIFLCFRV